MCLDSINLMCQKLYCPVLLYLILLGYFVIVVIERKLYEGFKFIECIIFGLNICRYV